MRTLILFLLLTTVCMGAASYDFDATDDYIDTNYSTNHSTLTISAWIQPNSDGQGDSGRIFEKFGSGNLVVQSFLYQIDDWRFSHAFGSSNGQWDVQGVVVPDGTTWYHLAITYDNTSTTNDPVMYVDGVSQTVTEVNTPSGSPTTDLVDYFIGNRPFDFGRTFDGNIAYFQIHNRILAEWEINEIMHCPVSIVDGLVFYSQLIDNGGPIDLTGNSSPTNNGATASSDGPPVSYCGGMN